jgi:uncharacterized protein (DUF1015 family)
MADILPLKAYRYHASAGNIEDLARALFIDTGTAQNHHLYSIDHLLNTPLYEIRSKLSAWKKNKILVRDPLPAIYVLNQYFKCPDTQKQLCQKGFICVIKASDWNENIIFRHENTIPENSGYHNTLLEQTDMNFSPVHGLYIDDQDQLESYMQESAANPIWKFTNHSVLNSLSAIHDHHVIGTFMKVLKNKTIVLADGHHRYNAVLQRKHKTGESYLSIYLTNTINNDIKILPFHRLVNPEYFDENDFMNLLGQYFYVFRYPDLHQFQNEFDHKTYSFGIITQNSFYIIELKNQLPELMIKEYDQGVNIVDDLIILKSLGIEKFNGQISYENDLNNCIRSIGERKNKVAVILKGLSKDEVVKVALSGLVLPEKSTYFYPKLPSGLIMNSMAKEDVETSMDCYEKPEIKPFRNTG